MYYKIDSFMTSELKVGLVGNNSLTLRLFSFLSLLSYLLPINCVYFSPDANDCILSIAYFCHSS